MNICLTRPGHLGDVILSEPIGRFFKSSHHNVYMATEFLQAKLLISDSYTGFIKLSTMNLAQSRFHRVMPLNYERHPGLSYIDAFAKSAGITLTDKIPRIKQDWKNIIPGDYVLIAPFVSYWMNSMRNWGIENFRLLQANIEKNIRVVVLSKEFSFTDMLSLIRHAKLLIGCDSAPGVIAQCFNVKTAIIFGCTHPRYAFFNPNANAIFRTDIDCIGCRHISRHTEIECASPYCLSELSVEKVFASVEKILNKPLENFIHNK